MENMEIEAVLVPENILQIYLISLKEKALVNELEFNNIKRKVYNGGVEKIEIPQEFFEENETKRSSIKLFNNSNLVNECIIDIFKGYNCSYCVLDEKGYTIQLLFKQMDPKIRIPIFQDKYYDIKCYDTNQTLNRKRFSILNLSCFSILINDEIFTIPAFAPKIKSYQFSFYDIKKKLVITKPLSIEKPDIFIQSFRKYNSLSYEFNQNIAKLARKNKFKEIQNNLSNFKFFDKLEFFFNKSKEKLEKILNNELHIEFYENYSLYKVIKKIAKNNISSLGEIINLYNETIGRIKNNQSLKIYQKILLIDFFRNICCSFQTKEKIVEANFTFYLMEEKEDYSVLDLVEKFFKEYRNKLKENSPIFDKLIELDASPGIYKRRKFYCFNMQNLSELKKHLKEIETSIFVTHNSNDKNAAYTHIKSGIVSVNIHNIKQLKNLDFPLNKALPQDKIEIGKSIAGKIIYYLLHEINGHKKYSFKINKIMSSPTNFIENGKIYNLCQKNSNSKRKNMIKIVPNNNIGEDGFYYELCYGKINDYYTFEIMDHLSDFSELFSDIDLWVNKLDTLKEYVKYKFALQHFGSNYKSNQIKIEDKIQDYKNEFQKIERENNIIIDQIFKKDKENKYNIIKTIDDSENDEEEEKSKQEINKKKELYDNEESEKKNNLSKQNKISSIKPKISIKDEKRKVKSKEYNEIKKEEEEEEEEEEGEEEEEEEDDEDEDFVGFRAKRKKFMKLPYETLLAIEKTGILTKKQAEKFRERRDSLLNCIRYIPDDDEI